MSITCDGHVFNAESEDLEEKIKWATYLVGLGIPEKDWKNMKKIIEDEKNSAYNRNFPTVENRAEIAFNKLKKSI